MILTSLLAGRGDLPWPASASQPGEAGRLLLRGREPPPRLRVHGAWQPREPPLQTDSCRAAVVDPIKHRGWRREGFGVPPRRREAGHLP
jgi:hypothetical protein